MPLGSDRLAASVMVPQPPPPDDRRLVVTLLLIRRTERDRVRSTHSPCERLPNGTEIISRKPVAGADNSEARQDDLDGEAPLGVTGCDGAVVNSHRTTGDREPQPGKGQYPCAGLRLSVA